MGPSKVLRVAGASGAPYESANALLGLAHNYPTDHIDAIVGNWTGRVGAFMDGESADHSFLEALSKALADIAEHKIKVIASVGAQGAQNIFQKAQELASTKGLKIARVSAGDALLSVKKQLDQGRDFDSIHTGQRLSTWSKSPSSAKVQLGGFGVVKALSLGADIVICDGVAASSLTVGLAAWWHGWNNGHYEHLANSLIAGQLIIGTTSLTGGNFSGFKNLQGTGWANLGLPTAEIHGSGNVVLTKTSGSGGFLTADTCTSQLLRDLHGPWYLSADVVAILDSVAFETQAENKVALRGVRGDAPPPSAQVIFSTRVGYQSEAFFEIIGQDAREKAAIFEVNLCRGLENAGIRLSKLSFAATGVAEENPKTIAAASTVITVRAQSPILADVSPSKFNRVCWQAATNSAPGRISMILDTDLGIIVRSLPATVQPVEVHDQFTTSVPQSAFAHVVTVPVSEPLTIDPPSHTIYYPARQPTAAARSPPRVRRAPKTKGGVTDAAGGWAELPAQVGRNVVREVFGPWGRTSRRPLGTLVDTTSHSSDPNSICIGFWVPRNGSLYEWLRSIMTAAKVKELLGKDFIAGGEASRAEAARFEFHSLRAVYFVVSLREAPLLGRELDASAAAELVKARLVDVPTRFLERKPKI